MPIDAFAATGIAPPAQSASNQPIDAFAATGIAPALNTSPLISGVAGFNQGFESLPRTLANLGAKGLDLSGLTNNAAQNVNNFYGQRSMQDQSLINQNPLAGKIGNVAGNIGASLPMYVAAGANIPLNAAAGAWSGYSQSNPYDTLTQRLINSGVGAGTSAALSLIPFGLGKAREGMQTQEYAQNLLNQLGGGKSLEENGKSLAQDLQNSYENEVSNAKAKYQPVFNQYGNNSIYPLVNPQANSQYLNLDKSITDDFNNRTLNNLHQEFMDNPTLQNAHTLQSQLGTSIRTIQNRNLKGNGSIGDTNTMEGYIEARNALKNDMNSFLTKVNPQAAAQYNLGSQQWAQNVMPYLANPKLSQIVQGEITNPRTVTSLFQNPEPEMQQIVEDMGPNTANKILYSQLGKTQDNLTPQNLINSFNSLDKNGLASYVTPDVANQMQTLAAKSAAKNNTQNILGAAIGSHFGGVPGAAAGAWLTPKLAQMVNSPLVAALLKGAGRGATVLPSTLTPNVIPYFNQQGGQ